MTLVYRKVRNVCGVDNGHGVLTGYGTLIVIGSKDKSPKRPLPLSRQIERRHCPAANDPSNGIVRRVQLEREGRTLRGS